MPEGIGPTRRARGPYPAELGAQRAALAMGPAGKGLLLPLVRDGGIDETTAAAAIEALGTPAPLDAVIEVLRRALGPRPMDEVVDVRAARVCLAVLGALGGAYTISRLEVVLLTVPPLADDAARALARIGGPAAEEALIAGLASARPECRKAVVPVLAEMGTAAAVAPLMDVQRHGGDLRWQAQWAITQIQSRLTGEAGAFGGGVGVLETAVVLFGLAGMAGFTTLALHFGLKRQAARRAAEIPPADLALLRAAAAPLTLRVRGEVVPGEHGITLVIEGVCDRLTLRREVRRSGPSPGSQSRADGALIRALELEVSDAAFDAAFLVLGPPTLVSAVLDAETRRWLLALAGPMRAGATVVERGALTIGIGHRTDPGEVRRRGQEAVALARRLVKPPDVLQRLADNVHRDPVPGVRIRCLEALLREEPGSPATRQVLRAAAGDREVEVRLRAAIALGPEGHAVLVSVADDEAADDVAVERALQGLGAGAAIEVVGRALGRGLGGHPERGLKKPRAVRARPGRAGRRWRPGGDFQAGERPGRLSSDRRRRRARPGADRRPGRGGGPDRRPGLGAPGVPAGAVGHHADPVAPHGRGRGRLAGRR